MVLSPDDEYLQKVRTNKEIATVLAENVYDLVSAIDVTVKGVRREIESIEKHAGRDERTAFRPDQYNQPGQFNTIINSLNVYVHPTCNAKNLVF